MSEIIPSSLGIAGRLTKAFIASSLTPLFILASLAAELVALGALPREEEPQISVPMVDIHVAARGLKAEDAVKMVTEPLEVIVKGIAGVDHVYSQTRGDAVGRALEDQPGAPEIVLNGQPGDEIWPVLLWDGEWEVIWITFRNMGAAFGIVLLGIYILVVAQFGSFKLPLVILMPIPLTFLGIMFGHWLFAAPFSATAMIGFIALAGIIVRNSILLVDFIRGEGRVTIESLIRAGTIRFKPIFLTAVAAMIGAAVILADPIFQGLAISLLFGLRQALLHKSSVWIHLVNPAW